MIYSGIIKGENNKTLSDAYIQVKQDGNDLIIIRADNYGYWEIDTDTDGGLLEPNKSWSFCATGYPCYNIGANLIPAQFDVDLSKAKSMLPYLIGGAALALLAVSTTKKKSKVSGFKSEDVKTVVYVIGGIMVISVANKVLKALGLFSDPNDAALDNEGNKPTSPWNINYWQQFYPDDSGTRNLTEDTGNAIAAKIWSDLGVFWDDEDGVIGAIHQLKSKADVSFVAWCFYYQKGSDLLTYLRNGRGSLPQNGLSSADVASLNAFVQNLPNY